MLYDKRWDAKLKPKPTTTRDVLLAAADLIEQRGWCTHKYRTSRGEHCMLGAVRSVTRKHSLRMFAEMRINAHLHAGVVLWNDMFCPSKEHAVKALRDAAEVCPMYVTEGAD